MCPSPVHDVGSTSPASAPELCPRVAETHTGMVFLVGDKAYKVKKPIVTDFLDFSTVERREHACNREVALNRRLAPDSYLGVAHFTLPGCGAAEPVIVMRRYPDEWRLAAKVLRGGPVEQELSAVADLLVRFHATAVRGGQVDAQAQVDAIAGRWQENVTELAKFAGGIVPGLSPDVVGEIGRLATRYIAGRALLFSSRIGDRKIVDGHADLLADDIFCLAGGPALLDCLEFDDRLRYIDVVDDAAFLAMDLEFLGRPDLGEYFLQQYRRFSAADGGEDSPASLHDFYIAYRAVVRAKVDGISHTQGDADAASRAQRHLEIAHRHLRAGAVRLILVGGGPGTGKTTLARLLAERIGAHVVSTDDVRAEMVAKGEIAGVAGEFGKGLYTDEKVDAVYDTVLHAAHLSLSSGHSVILDGTWRDARHREHARSLAVETSATVIEFSCTATLATAVDRIRSRTETTSQATPEIAAALAAEHLNEPWAHAHPVDMTRPVAESVAEAQQICLLNC